VLERGLQQKFMSGKGFMPRLHERPHNTGKGRGEKEDAPRSMSGVNKEIGISLL
jgi:hypothetical protein